MKNKEKGITLIALIITIIILLILAIVSIKLVVDQRLLSVTKEAIIKHQVAQIEEALKIKINEEEIIRATEKGEKDPNTGAITWENTPYLNLLDMLMSPEVYQYYYGVGNLYNKSTEEIINKNLVWFPTDIIYNKNNEDIEAEDLKIEIQIGNNGYISVIESTEETLLSLTKNPKDIFLIDEEYNIYYVDEEGKVIYSTNKSYKLNEEVVLRKGKYINPDNLTGKNKEAYEGIYEGALAFTENEEYASYLASNDIDSTTTINTFFYGGFAKLDILKDNQIVTLENGTELKRLVLLMTRPDWTTVRIFNDSIKMNYYMDANYNMYKIDETNSNNLKIYDQNNNLLVEGAEFGPVDLEPIEKIVTDGSKYAYVERFDNKGVLILAVPEKEMVDMKTDLEGMNVFSIAIANENSVVKRIILPETVETLSFLALGRILTDDTGISSMFDNVPNLEYIELSNKIQKLYTRTFLNCSNLKTVIMPDNIDAIGENAFLGCDGVTLKFKDGKAPSGSPWGGTNINITSK